MIRIKNGLDIPIAGAPSTDISRFEKKPKKIAVIGADFVGMKPTMKVQVGDKVKIGDVLFTDKKTEGVVYTSPVNGEVLEVNRGAKRFFQSIVISNDGEESVSFSENSTKDLLLKSGEWTALRERPYDKVADPNKEVDSIFVTAMDTNPLAPSVSAIINHDNNKDLFNSGLKAISSLTKGKVYLCTAEDFQHDGTSIDNLVHKKFSGPHPAGLAGTHIHFVAPVSLKKPAWYIGYQDVIAIGHLVKHNTLHTDRYVSIAGPEANKPQIYKVRRGTEITETFSSEAKNPSKDRFIAGTILNGRTATGPYNFLGRFQNGIAILEDEAEREFLGWQSPGLNKFSVQRAFLSSLMPGKKFNFTTNKNGSDRAIVPVGSYEKVMPLDILPTYLLRTLKAGDTDKAQQLGALELAEEDLALCSYVDPGKDNFGVDLRSVLETIEKDG